MMITIIMNMITTINNQRITTYQNFVVLASQKFPGIWHRLFDQPLYIDFGGVFSFSVRVWSWKLFQIYDPLVFGAAIRGLVDLNIVLRRVIKTTRRRAR